MRTLRALIGITGLLATMAQAVTPDSLTSCRAISDASARLACYDALPLTAPVAISSPVAKAAPVATPAPAAAIAPTSAVAAVAPSASSEQAFGMERKIEQTLPEQMDMQVKTVRYTARKKLQLEFTNGQRWEQTGTDSVSIKAGDQCVIRRGMMSGYYLQTSRSNRTMTVKRLD